MYCRYRKWRNVLAKSFVKNYLMSMFCLQKSVENIVIIVLIGNRYILNNVNVVLLNNDDKQGLGRTCVCIYSKINAPIFPPSERIKFSPTF